MKFTALPVKEGDSFLLETGSKNILVDTGKDDNECRDFLLKKDIGKLDLVIITHYDRDHVNGLLNLLKSVIEIAEIWLPENFGRINKTLKQEKYNLIKGILDKDIESNEKKEEIFIHSFSNQYRRRAHINNISDTENESNRIISITHYPSRERKGNFEESIKRVDEEIVSLIQTESNILITYINGNHINKINQIVEESNKKTNIRWLKYTGEFQNERINNEINILGLNCKENKNIKEYFDDLEMVFHLTQINRESLVFKYHYDQSPNILFSADSGFEFLSGNQKIGLNNKSLVTAAHHGSKDKLNVNTYSLVNGQNLTYIRSDNVNKHRPCCRYIKLKKKYCTVCNTMTNNNKEEIFLDCKSNNWLTNNNTCSCKDDC